MKLRQILPAVSAMIIVLYPSDAECEKQKITVEEIGSKNYSARLLRTIGGDFVKTDTLHFDEGLTEGITFVLRTSKTQTLAVHVGPAWFLAEQLILNPGDYIEATGAMITYEGKPMLLAKTIIVHGNKYIVRNNNGTPAWKRESLQRW
jgi:hypothetical protein